jgi:trehalose 6-phosphate synthase
MGPMRRSLRFALFLVLGLGLITWIAERAVRETTRHWFEKDVTLRAHLAVAGSRRALVRYWRERDLVQLKELLVDLTRDERIMAAAICGADLKRVVATDDFPRDRFRCEEIGLAVSARGAWNEWHKVSEQPGGPVFVSGLPLLDGAQPVGLVVLLHDMSYVQRREGQTQRFLLLAFAVLAAAASLVTVIASRLSWREWSNELRRLLRGGEQRPDFRPVLQDVRELAQRLAFEAGAPDGHVLWTAERLKQALGRYLGGERVVIVANREPYIHDRRPDGQIAVLHPASGLVTALEPVMRACSGVWVAHGSGSADRDTVDSANRVRVPPGDESYSIRRVWLSSEEERGYYYGFANEGLWPLCHIAHTRPNFRSEDWRHYQTVNQRFADAVCDEVDSDDPIVLVQDYHFALAPRLIRARLPRATVISFWHIPWPNGERFGICPFRNEILEGMLGSSIVGFHTQLHCNNFKDAVERYMEARVDREESAVVFQGRSTLVRAYPISVEWPSRWTSTAPAPAESRTKVLAELGLPAHTLLGVGVDRLDYTKGIEERLLAVERLLERFPSFRGRFTFVQLAAPSRTIIERYRQLNEAVEAVAARVNARFGSGAYRPVVLRRAHHEPPEIVRYYRAANLCYVSSLHDGMNLVAKEFVAAREDERGVLVLSSFTGAARELTEALIVNPYDLDEASSAMATALTMGADEQRERMRAMRTLVSEFNVYRWAGRMLVDAARLRRHDRLAGRLAGGGVDLERTA